MDCTLFLLFAIIVLYMQVKRRTAEFAFPRGCVAFSCPGIWVFARFAALPLSPYCPQLPGVFVPPLPAVVDGLHYE